MPTDCLAIIPAMSSRRLLLAFVALSCSLSAQAEAYVARWGGSDTEGSLIVQLNSDRSCRIVAHSNRLDRDTRISCTYWLHGSRIRLRTKGQRGDEGLGEMDLEYVPQSDTVIIHGPTPRFLARQPDPA